MLIDLARLITNPTAALTAIHGKYGECVSTSFFNKKLLFTSNPEHFEELFNQEARGLLNRDSLYEAKQPMFGDGLFNSSGSTWTNQRRLMQPYFSKQGIDVWKNIMLEEAEAAAMRISEAGNTHINISHEMKETIQKIMVRVLFNRSMSGAADKQLMESVDTIVKGLFPHLLAETLGKGKLKNLLFLQNRRMRNAISYFAGYVDKEIERGKREQHQNGLISMLIQASDKSTGYRMSNRLLRDEAVTMFLAGQDTTVNTLVWFFYLVGKHPEVHEKITAEIQRLIGERVTLDDIDNLRYTKAALYETLRLYPQAIGLSRDVAEKITLGGKAIDAGTSVIMSIYATHRDTAIWPHPDEFYPNHFLDESSQDRHKYAFLPFGGGMHTCVGKHFAEVEMMIIIATILKERSVKTTSLVSPTVSITYKPERDIILSITPNTLL
ncbi:hypothetical protein A1353_19110 [Methylomonas methanica]|uniref:Cytochrome P450 n=1 Tax=Methylomonas methanica TaxID=421 RepID=A0A177M808_METMH|nr:cytochrome P450 [Methylomonas methanica]OAI00919.1 hypothetical protein A1353_19110 [Methylomonas methanica]